jgi:glutathione S-transferase
VIRLYGYGTSRWVRPLWMLRELGVEHEAIELDRAAGELDTPGFRTLNPQGKVPVLVDRGVAICESAAIVLYLGDRFPSSLVPAAGTPERGLHDARVMQIVTEFEPPLWWWHRSVKYGEGGVEVARLAQENLAVAAAALELPETFQAADILLSTLLTWRVVQPFLKDFPELLAYRDRTTSRPAFPRYLFDREAP